MTTIEEIQAAAERLKQVRENGRNGDVGWISKVYEWPNPRPKTNYETDRNLIVNAFLDGQLRITGYEE